MANIITTLGHDPVGMKRATERALGQISGELDRIETIDSGVTELAAKVDEQAALIAANTAEISSLESAVTALDGRVGALETWVANLAAVVQDHEERIQVLEAAP